MYPVYLHHIDRHLLRNTSQKCKWSVLVGAERATAAQSSLGGMCSGKQRLHDLTKAISQSGRCRKTQARPRSLAHPGIFSSGSEKGVDLFRPYVSLRGIPVRMADIFGKMLQVTEEPSLKTTGETCWEGTKTTLGTSVSGGKLGQVRCH